MGVDDRSKEPEYFWLNAALEFFIVFFFLPGACFPAYVNFDKKREGLDKIKLFTHLIKGSFD